MNEIQIQKLKTGIFIGDSAVTSHMTNDMTGLYNLQKTSDCVTIGNGQDISCTYKGLLDMICVQMNGSMAKDTWEIKVVIYSVPQVP